MTKSFFMFAPTTGHGHEVTVAIPKREGSKWTKHTGIIIPRKRRKNS